MAAAAQDHQYSADQIQAGYRLYSNQCQICHAATGDGIAGINLARQQFHTVVTDDDIRKMITTGNPQGMPQPVLTGFLTDKGDETHGRPVWLAWDKPGALLVSDDTAGVIWRVMAPGAAPSVSPKPVVTAHMPPQRALNGDPNAEQQATLGEERHEMQQR